MTKRTSKQILKEIDKLKLEYDKVIKKELKILKKSCSHPDVSISFLSFRKDRQYMHTCDDCKKYIFSNSCYKDTLK